jgi:hypothetical protein
LFYDSKINSQNYSIQVRLIMESINKRVKNWVELYDEYLSDQFEYPDEAKLEYSAFLAETKEILKCFGLPNRKHYTSILYQIIDEGLCQNETAPNLFQLSVHNSQTLSYQLIEILKGFRSSQAKAE